MLAICLCLNSAMMMVKAVEYSRKEIIQRTSLMLFVPSDSKKILISTDKLNSVHNSELLTKHIEIEKLKSDKVAPSIQLKPDIFQNPVKFIEMFKVDK